MKKYLFDLEYSEIKTLIQNNESLERQLLDWTTDNSNDYVNDILYDCPANYAVGTCTQRDHFTITGTKAQFLSWAEQVCNDYGFFTTAQMNIISNWTLWNDEDIVLPTTQYDIEQMVYNKLIGYYDFDIDDYIDAFYNNYIDWYFPDNEGLYTDEKLTNIYRDIPEITIPAHVESVF